MVNERLIDKRYRIFCKRIFDMADDYDYFIFVSRKCYYYTKTVRESQTLDTRPSSHQQKAREIRDRDLLKEIDFSIFESKKILLVDDTLYTGNTLFSIMDRITGKTKSVFIDIAVFAVITDAVFEFLEDSRFISHGKMCMEVFSYAQMSEFVIKELQAIQESRHSYVIDLPVFKEIEFSEEDFDKLTEEKNAGWMFTKYKVNIKDGSYDNGFFIYDNRYIKNILGNALIDLVVKCRYERKVTEDDRRVIFCRFTPFAMLRSMEYEDVWHYFTFLFTDTEYLLFLQNNKCKIKDQDDYITIYRSLIYTLSYFTGEVFRSYTRNQTGKEPILLKNLSKVDLNEMFSRGIDSIFKEFSITNFYKRLPERQSNPDLTMETTENKLPVDMKTIETWFIEWLSMRKRNYLIAVDSRANASQVVTVEEIERKLEDQYIFSSRKQMQSCLLCIILKALDMGALSNHVQLENGLIKRCLRLGESCDILSEYDITVFYAAVYSYYNRTALYSNKYQKFYEYFVKTLKNYLAVNDYFTNKYISEREYDFLAEYFNMDGNVLKREIENKRHFLCRNLSHEKRHVRDVIDFVYYLQLEDESKENVVWN